MTTALKFSPADHGRPVTSEELANAEYAEGYNYEIIYGRLYVSPIPNAPEGWINNWVHTQLFLYSQKRPDVVNFVYTKIRVFVHSEPEETVPEPDLAAYEDFPLDTPPEDLKWEEVSPILVVEVLRDGDSDKDLVRNVRLYRKVPSIREYWILDARERASQPKLIVYRRQGTRWRRYEYEGGSTYTTRLLPDFELVLDTRQQPQA